MNRRSQQQQQQSRQTTTKISDARSNSIETNGKILDAERRLQQQQQQQHAISNTHPVPEDTPQEIPPLPLPSLVF